MLRQLHVGSGVTRLLFVITLVVVGLTTFSASPAHAASQPVAKPAQNCQIVLDKLHPGETVSRVLSQQCAQTNQSLAAPLATSQTVLIMTWYSGAFYTGNSTRIYGYYGPCDSSGYGIANSNGWNPASFKAWNNCNYTREFTDINYGRYCYNITGNDPFTLSYNKSFWLTSGYIGC